MTRVHLKWQPPGSEPFTPKATMFTKLSSKFYYWHLFMGLSVFNFALFMGATYHQYWFSSAETMPEYLAGVLTQADWKAMQAKTFPLLSWFLFDFFITSILPTIFIARSGTGFSAVPRAAEQLKKMALWSRNGLTGFMVSMQPSWHLWSPRCISFSQLLPGEAGTPFRPSSR